MVFLPLGGFNRIHAGRAAQLLALAYNRSGGVLRNHETAVQARLLDQEARQFPLASNQLVGTAFGNIAQFGHGDAQEILSQGQRLAVEVAGGNNQILVRENRRVVGHGIDFLERNPAHVFNGIFRSSVNLRDAAERIGILHMRLVTFNHLAAFQVFAESRSGIHLALVTAYLLDFRIERLDAAIKGFQRQSPDQIGHLAQMLRLHHVVHRKRAHELRAIEQSQTFFGCQFYRLPAMLGQDFRSRAFFPVHPDFAQADQRQAHMRQRSQVARCA